jgi:CRP-like cAMP-binding protein
MDFQVMQAGETIFFIGDEGETFYFIIEGTVEILKPDQ